MQRIFKRLSALGYLARPLALAFVGIVLLSIGVAYFFIMAYRSAALPEVFQILTLQFLPRWARGLAFTAVGLAVLLAGIWQLSGLAVIPLDGRANGLDELVLGYRSEVAAPRIAVLSGGAGMLMLAALGHYASKLTCITPAQDPVEYYYRASSLFNYQNVYYVAPTPVPVRVDVELDNGARLNIKQNISHDERLAARHVANLFLTSADGSDALPEVTRLTLDSLAGSDAIIFGPGSLFESILPNLLLPQVREAIRRSKARKIYICNLMTEPGLTTGFGVADHIRQIVRYGGFAPDYVLINAQRIAPEVRQIYQAANQTPVYLNPEEYEETIVSSTGQLTAREVIVEGAVVIEADLASAVVQLTASLDHPGERRSVRVLRHDADKLVAAIQEILRRD